MEKLGVENWQEFQSRYNIAPSTVVPAVRTAAETRKRQAVGLQWGLVPFWAKDARDGAKLANARAEGIASKAAFREPVRKRRCVVPASGFYEWQTIGRLKQPWLFQFKDEGPFVFAGLWERWRSVDGVELQTCSLITTRPTDVIRPLHDRMPVILRDAAIDRWLDPANTDPAQLEPLLAPLPDGTLKATPVSPLVNSVRNDGPECILPATPISPEPPPPPQLSLGLE